MSTTIAGHTLTDSQLRTLDSLQDYMRMNAGDSFASSTTSPKGDGRRISLIEIWGRSGQATAHRRNVQKLQLLGVLKSCEMEFGDGGVAFAPLKGA